MQAERRSEQGVLSCLHRAEKPDVLLDPGLCFIPAVAIGDFVAETGSQASFVDSLRNLIQAA